MSRAAAGPSRNVVSPRSRRNTAGPDASVSSRRVSVDSESLTSTYRQPSEYQSRFLPVRSWVGLAPTRHRSGAPVRPEETVRS